MTPEAIDPVAASILDAARGNPELGVPCFVGPPQEGKTHFVAAYAASRGLSLVVWNPQTTEPEEAAGLPHKYRSGGQLRATYSTPPMLPEAFVRDVERGQGDRWIIFVDEVDKAERYKLSALLTFFSALEHRLGRFVIPPGTLRVAAMNPPEAPLPEALVERMLFIPWPRTRETRLVGVEPWFRPLAESILGDSVPPIEFPARTATKGAIHRLQAWGRLDVFWRDEALRETVVYGLLPKKTASETLARLKERPTPRWELWAQVVRPQDLRSQFVEVANAALEAAGPEGVQAIFAAMVERGQNDPTGEWTRAVVDLLDDYPTLARVGVGVKLPTKKGA